MLYAWAAELYPRHAGDFDTEGVRFPLRVGPKTHWPTSEQALTALVRTVQELDTALDGYGDWGTDSHGRPSELAMRGLINRRFGTRLVDQIRTSPGPPLASLSSPVRAADVDGPTLGDTLPSARDLVGIEHLIWLGQVLADEPQVTREVVLRRAADEPSAGIAAGLGIGEAVVRQRFSRFRRRQSEELIDAA